MKNIIKFLLLLTTVNSFSQIEFEKGYFITNDGSKIDCWIRNIAWEYNPEEFDYKLSETDESKVAKITDVKEFNVSNTYKFVRYTTNINKSNLDLERVDLFKDPKLEVKTIFLKVIDEGKATLYEYITKNKRTYYYSIAPHETAELLIFKEYNFDQSTLKENNYYKQQLLTILNSEKLNQSDFIQLKYNKDKLSKLFSKYNNSQSTNGNENFSKKQNQSSINFKALVGINFISVDFLAIYDIKKQIDFKPSPIIGFETEYILPFNQKKWSIFVSPNYQSLTIKETLDHTNYYLQNEFGNTNLNTLGNYKRPLILSYSKIEIPIGARHYLYLNKNSKISLNVGFILNVMIKSNLEYTNTKYNAIGFDSLNSYTTKTKFSSDSGIFLGIGYNYKTLSFEIRHNSKTYPPVEDVSSYIGISSLGILTSYKFL